MPQQPPHIEHLYYWPPLQAVNLCGMDIEVVTKYKYLGLNLYNKLGWSLMRFSFSLCIYNKMLKMFLQSEVVSVPFCAAVCWSGSIRNEDGRRLEKLVRRAGSVGDTLGEVMKQCPLKTLETNSDHLVHNIFMEQIKKHPYWKTRRSPL